MNGRGKRHVQEALRTFEAGDVEVDGFVLTKSATERGGSYYYYYGAARDGVARSVRKSRGGRSAQARARSREKARAASPR